MEVISAELKKKISELSDQGWWKSENEDVFLNRAQELKDKGLKEFDIFLLLEDLYCAVKSEYGE